MSDELPPTGGDQPSQPERPPQQARGIPPMPSGSRIDDERRSGFDRRSVERRQEDAEHEPERRSGEERRTGEERREADRVRAEDLSLGRRMRQPRTIISLVLPVLLLILFFRALPGFNLAELPELISSANPWLILAAFVIFYIGFPLRGLRWATLIRATGFPLRTRDATEIIGLSWLVNCLVPAKLGDVYRAYLLKINSPVSLSRTFGTVFIERVLDLFAIVVLGLAAGYWSFRSGLPPAVQFVFAAGVVVVVAMAAGLLTMRNFGRKVILRLPLPHRVIEFYDRFEEGVFSAIGLSALPRLIILTLLIWSTEGLRLFFVIAALGFDDVQIGLSGAFFVALTGSLLTAVPLTPAGIGVVEAGVVFVLTVVYNVPQTEALAITLVDRAISVVSVIIFGSILYAVSPLRRGKGIKGATGTAVPAPGPTA